MPVTADIFCHPETGSTVVPKTLRVMAPFIGLIISQGADEHAVIGSHEGRFKQLARIWCVRDPRLEIMFREFINEDTALHHQYPVTHMGDDGKVMADQEESEVTLLPLIGQQVKHFGLNRDVQG
jgi:hypothetical protein